MTDTQSQIELQKLPVTQGEASFPAPPVNTKRRRNEGNPEDDDEFLVPIPPWTCREITVAGAAGICVIVSIIIVLIPFFNPFVFLTGIFGILVPPYSALQEQKITDTKAMKETNIAMEREVDNLKHENERLAYENDRLESAVSSLQQTKDVLAEVQKSNVQSLSALEDQLAESQDILNEMEENRRAALIDNMFEVMVAVDDGDFILSDEEIEMIIKKAERIQGIEIHDELFKQKIIEAGRDLDAVMKLVDGLLDDDPNTEPEEQKIITFLSVNRMSDW